MKKPRQRVTERPNPAARHLEEKSALKILRIINREDARVASAVRKVLPQIARAVEIATRALAQGGRLIYLGAGTSGRMGVLDAAECLPTFGTGCVQAVMAGAPRSIFEAVEGCEDDPSLAVRDLRRIKLTRRDVVVGISASGTTPFTLGGMRYARKLGARTIALTCNPQAPMRASASISIIPVVGPEIIAGSSRMKAGTAQKMVLNMLSTATMVRLGRTFSGAMIGVQINNQKLRRRGLEILMKLAKVPESRASAALDSSGRNLPVALVMLRHKVSKKEAAQLLKAEPNISSILKAGSP